MSSYIEQIRSAVYGRHPIVYLQSPEEDRIISTLERLASECFADGTVTTWTCTEGLLPSSKKGDTRDPVKAVQTLMTAPHAGFYVMKDLSLFMERPDVIRVLRDAYYVLARATNACLVILSPELVLPTILEKEICLVEVDLPTTEELLERVVNVQKGYPHYQIPEALHSELALSLKGLTLNEVGHIMHRVAHNGTTDDQEVIREIFSQKETLVKKAGILEYVPPRLNMDQMGGMGNLKDWILKRRALFNQESVDKGLPVPKGILVMGVSGCGKSLCAKVVAAFWKLPLFRLDMNLVHSNSFGTPEITFHRALKTVESVAPAILWIDEIENGLNMTPGSQTGGGNHIFSAFLTWMQEKPPLVFVAATANQIQALPAEVIRKGRFDQVFFCDLPTDEERPKIIEIHLKNAGADPSEFDYEYLTMATEGWNGAEVEQAVIAARIDALQENRKFTTRDLARQIRNIVPLSETMKEQIKAIRSWAWGRATPASSTKGRKMS